MSYLVLARKYRPRSFAEMVGQEHVVQALSNALVQQRLHHAYLFTGTRGVGKTTVSRVLAKSLNCQGPDGTGGITAQPCGQCAACRAIDAGRFVDYTELDAASNRGVDEVQSLLEQAVYKPVQGRFKVFMIDEVHMLTNTAFNAMLKTLEEPPEYLKFVLATTDPQKVPATVLSRCLQFNLRPMAPDTVFDHLSHVLAQEQLSAEPAALRLLARAARGSMRDALSLADQAIAFGSGQLQEAAVRQMLGSVDRDHVMQLIGALAQSDGRQVVALVDALRVQGVAAAATLEDMCAVLHRMAVCQALAPAAQDGPDPHADPEVLATQALAQSMSPEETQLLYSLCLHGRAELGLAPDEYAALVMVLLRLLAFQPAGRAPRPAALPEAEKKSPDAAAPAAASAPVAAIADTHSSSSAPSSASRPEPSLIRAGYPAPVPPELGQGPAQPQPRPLAKPHPPEAAQAPAIAQSADAHRADAHRTDAQGDAPPWDDWDESQLSDHLPDQPALAPQLQALPVRQPAPQSLAPSRADVLKRPQLPLVPTPEGEVWMAAVNQLLAAEAITALVRELALQSQLVARTGDVWQLQVDSESLLSPSLQVRLQAALHAQGHALQLQVGLAAQGVSDTPAKRMAQQTSARLTVATQLIETDPRVQALVRDFGARVLPGSIQAL